MRTISEQELKNILDKHDKWLRNEAGAERANLSYTNLRSADLRYADLSSADLRYANLRYADLRNTDLRYADLRNTDLRSADLRYTDLRYADLRNTDLRNADLRNTDLRYADLRETGIMTFNYEQNTAYYTPDGSLIIGCICMPVSEWELGFKEIGKANGYTDEQIEEYGVFISRCVIKFKKGSK